MIGARPLTDDEFELLINSLHTERDKMLFLLGVKTGFRISELLSIEVADVKEFNHLKASLTITKSKMKGQIASRSIPLNKTVLERLEVYVNSLPKSQKYLFESQKGNKLSRIQAWRCFKQAAIDNKLSGKVATHSWRKTFANKIYDKLKHDLVKTQKALGHVSINSTVSYLAFTNTEIEEAILGL